MSPRPTASIPVREIEVIEDFSSSARCDEGFLHLRRLRCRNLRSDGTASEIYRVDVVDRPRLDAVAVVIYRRHEAGALELLTRMNLRPAAWFRKDQHPAIPDGRSHLYCEEIVAGLLEPTDVGEEGLRHRAAEETREESGFTVSPDEVRRLGGPILVAPGIISEKIFLCAVDVTGKMQKVPQGDGSPLEEGGVTRWWRLDELVAACREGEIQDAKTELGAYRLLAMLQG